MRPLPVTAEPRAARRENFSVRLQQTSIPSEVKSSSVVGLRLRFLKPVFAENWRAPADNFGSSRNWWRKAPGSWRALTALIPTANLLLNLIFARSCIRLGQWLYSARAIFHWHFRWREAIPLLRWQQGTRS